MKRHVVIGKSETDFYLLGVFDTWSAAQAAIDSMRWHVIDDYEIFEVFANEMGVTWLWKSV